MLGPPACLPALDELLLAAKDAGHLVEVGGELGRASWSETRCSSRSSSSQVGPRGADGLERVSLVSERMLRQERDDDPAAADGGARVRLLEPGDQPQHASTCRSRSRRSRRRGRAARSRSRGRRARFGCRTTCGRRSGNEGHAATPLRTTESTYSSLPSRSASASRASPEIPVRRGEHLVEPVVADARRRDPRGRGARSPAAASRPVRTATPDRGSPVRRAAGRPAARPRGASRRAGACRRRGGSTATSPRAIPLPASRPRPESCRGETLASIRPPRSVQRMPWTAQPPTASSDQPECEESDEESCAS